VRSPTVSLLKSQPGERCSWVTMTRSAPLMMNSPAPVAKAQFHALLGGVAGPAEPVAHELQPDSLGRVLDREDLVEYLLNPDVLALFGGHVELEELPVGVLLDAGQVGDVNDAADL